MSKLINLTTGNTVGVYSSEALAIYARQALAACAPSSAELFVLRAGESLETCLSRAEEVVYVN